MRWVIRALVLFALIIGAFVGAERVIIYAFDPRRVAPGVAGLREVITENASGGDMYVWVAKARPGKPTILYLHGNAGNLNNRSYRFGEFIKRGYGVVAPAYRGSSGSAGWPTEAKIRRDIEKFYAELTSGALTGTPIRPLIYGESIGAAIAIHLNAALVDAPDGGVALPLGFVLEAPFTSLRDVAHAIQPELVLATGFMTSHWRSIDMAPALSAPLLVLHGRKDPLVPMDHGRAIFEAAGSDDKAFFEVTNAGHIDVWKRAAQQRLYRFLARF